jgi:putative flippase GtrA
VWPGKVPASFETFRTLSSYKAVRIESTVDECADDNSRFPEPMSAHMNSLDNGASSVTGRWRWVAKLRTTRFGRNHPARQLGRFLVVGLSNTVLSFLVYRLLLAIGAWYVLAAPVAFAAGALNGYVFNRRWTFAAPDTTRARVSYVVVQAAGALSTSLLVLFFVRAIGTGRVWAYLAAIPPVTLCMFAANRLWTFGKRT